MKLKGWACALRSKIQRWVVAAVPAAEGRSLSIWEAG